MLKQETVEWWADGAGFAKRGPYTSMVEAWAACMGHDGLPVPGARVWCTQRPAQSGELYPELTGEERY